jgi:uncharacterized protein YfaS (alpha-2-macroglobulin family)
MYGERRSVEAAVSTLPLAWGQGLSVYLDHYEYSCTEQLVSKGMAALVLTSRPEFGTVGAKGGKPLEATFSTLRGRANGSGGFGLWTSTPDTAEFPTVYAAHFLVEAKDRGQAIPTDLLTSVDSWLANRASTPASTLEAGRLRAYAVYLLARQGIKPAAALANVEQELANRHAPAWKTDLAAAYLASTYRLLQRTADADRLIAGVPWSTQKPAGATETYYDPVVHDAQLLYLLSRHFPARAGAVPPAALDAIGAAVTSRHVHSLSAAYVLLALDAYARSTPAGVTLGIAELGADGRQRPLPLPAGALPRVAVAEAAKSVVFSTSGGQAPAYYALTEAGFDRSAPAADVAKGLEIVREIVDAKGAVLTKVKVGEEFFIRLRLRTTGRERLDQVAVVDLLPGGTEAVVERQTTADSSQPGADPASTGARPSALPVGVPGVTTWSPEHVDLRDDRLVLYGTVTRSASTFVYRVRATNAGVFQVPPAFAEGMYDRSVTGLSTATTLEVVKP